MYLQRFAHYISWLANDSGKKISPPSASLANDIERGEVIDNVDPMAMNRVNMQGEQESLLQRLVEALPYQCSYICLPLGL